MKEVIEKVVSAWWAHLCDLNETLSCDCEEGEDDILYEPDEHDFKNRLIELYPHYTFTFDGDKWLIVQEF